MTEQTSKSGFNAKAIFSAVVAVVLALSLAIPAASAFAAPSDDKQAEADAALAQLQAYQAELEQASANYEAALQEQLTAEAAVAEAETKIEEKTTEIEGYQEQLGERAREMYRSGSTSFIDVILGASTFEEFATTWNMLELLNSNDAQLVQETKDARAELEEAKATAEEQAQVAADKVAECESIAAAADAQATQMQAVYDNLSAEAAELVAQEEAAEEAAAQAAANNAINNNNNNGGGSNNNNGGGGSNNNGGGGTTNNDKTPTVTGNTVVDRAYAQLGKPYAWGAVGPNSFDCSGLVGYCLTGRYARFCTTYTIEGWTRVTNPQPGDICIRSGHTGIYIGNGQMIHAPHTGDVVKISAVPSNMWYVRY